MIHYHGTPITPRDKLLLLAGRHFCVSFAQPQDLVTTHQIGQSVMLDNGAYSLWRSGRGDVKIGAFALWVLPWLDFRTTWCVIPDKIDGSRADNDALLKQWESYGLPRTQCAPVWHLHEPSGRLEWLCSEYPRVCIGSSAQFSKIGTDEWNNRMDEAMDAICKDGAPPCWLHMLRGLSLIGGRYPFASADSTNIARNYKGYKERRGFDLVQKAAAIDSVQCPARWATAETIGERMTT